MRPLSTEPSAIKGYLFKARSRSEFKFVCFMPSIRNFCLPDLCFSASVNFFFSSSNRDVWSEQWFRLFFNVCLTFTLIWRLHAFIGGSPQQRTADAEIEVPFVVNPELKASPFKAWSRSVQSLARFAYTVRVSLEKKLYYEFGSKPLYFLKIKCWKTHFFSCFF